MNLTDIQPIDIATAGAFSAIAFVAYFVFRASRGGRNNASQAIDPRTDPDFPTESKRSVASAFSRSMAAVIPALEREVKSIDRDLKRAGYYKATALVDYLASRNLMVVSALIATGCLAVMADPATTMPETIVGVGLLVALLTYAVPRMVLSSQAKKRVHRIQQGLPGALDIVSMCLSGGLPLRQSLARVSEDIRFVNPDVAAEFEILRRHSDANTMTRALKQFAARLDMPDINALAALVSQTDRLGTNVAVAICDYCDSVRRKQRQTAEEKASKTSIKLLFPIIFCLAPPIYILMVGPPLLQLRDFVLHARDAGGVLDPSGFGEDYEVPEEYQFGADADALSQQRNSAANQ